ncbi:MAG: DUF4340 domain-containing protein [Myxococcota bacterium]|nr:DUF4340 domain-containing protein [Myxococcota bacterium]
MVVAAQGAGPVNPRTTLILAVLVAALGAFIYWTEQDASEREVEGEAQPIFPDLDVADVTALSVLTSDDVRVRLERTEGVWALVEPLAFPADDLAAEGLASSLVDLASEAVFDEPEALSEYGLDVEPSLRFELGDDIRVLRVGDKSPVGGNTYVAQDGDARVFAVATWRVNALEKSLLDLRDRRLLDFDAGEVVALRVRWPGAEVSLSREDGADGAEAGWRMLSPVEARASDDTVEGLLTSLQFLRASGFVDEPPSDADAGLADPSFEAELSVAGSDELLRLSFGKLEGAATRLARGAVAGVLYEVDESRLGELPKRVSDYRFKTVAQFVAEDATGFELAFGSGEAVSGSRGESGWDTSPLAMAAGKAGRLVEELSGLEAVDILADQLGDDELEGLGLAPPIVTVRVQGEAGEAAPAPVLATVHLGAADPSRGIPAMRGDEPVVYWLDFDAAEHLPVSYEAFANRFVSEEGESAEEPEPPPLDAPMSLEGLDPTG